MGDNRLARTRITLREGVLFFYLKEYRQQICGEVMFSVVSVFQLIILSTGKVPCNYYP